MEKQSAVGLGYIIGESFGLGLWLEFNSGWTLGECIVGLTQDIAIITLIGASLWH